MSTNLTKKSTIDMTKGSIVVNILRFTIPLILTGLLQLAFSAADIMVVGQFTDPSVSNQAVASIGASNPIRFLLTNIFLGLSVGSTVITAKFFGAKQDKDISEAVHTAITLSLISGVILSILGVAVAEQSLIWMNTPESVLPYATKYLRIFFAGNLVTMLYNFGSAILRAVGDTKRPLIFLAISGVANVGFNLFFVLVLRLDVEGVAIGTLISQTISAVLILICLSKETGALKFSIKKLKITKDKLTEILRIGVPAGIQSSLFSVSNIFIQSSINGFGDIVAAGNSAAGNLEGFIQVFINSFNHTSVSCSSQNLGARDVKRVKKTLILSPIISGALGIIIGNVSLLFGEQLLSLYLTDELAIAEGLVRMKATFPLYFIGGIMNSITGFIRGTGFSIFPTIINLIGICGVRIIWVFTVFQIPEFHTISVLFISWPLSWFVVSLSLLIYYFAYAKKRIEFQCETINTKTENAETLSA